MVFGGLSCLDQIWRFLSHKSKQASKLLYTTGSGRVCILGRQRWENVLFSFLVVLVPYLSFLQELAFSLGTLRHSCEGLSVHVHTHVHVCVERDFDQWRFSHVCASL